MTITEFLRARLDEDGADLTEARWDGDAEWWMPDWLTRDRLQADLAAKRRIVDEHCSRITEYGDAPDENSCGRCGKWDEYPVAYPCPTVRILASVYADHPDYDPEWRA